MVAHISRADFDKEVLKSGVPVLVDFYAEWCGPCSMQAPILEEVFEAVEGKAKIVKVDVDSEGELAAQFGVMSIPTLIIFKNGEVSERLVGLQSKDSLIELLTK